MKAGWESTILGNVIDLQSGFAFKSAEFTGEGHFLMRIANVQDGDISLEKPKFVQLTKQTKRFELEEGDILTSLTGNVGRVAEIKASHLPAALNQRVARIKPKEDVDVDRSYLRHFLSSDAFSSFLEQEAHGAAQANVSPNAIKKVPFTLPPLDEQKRIVSILDEAFEGLDRARENAEANLKSARELFEERRRTLVSNKTTGEPLTLKDVCINFEYGTSSKSSATGCTPVLRMGNLQDGEIDWTNLVYTNDAGEGEKYMLHEGDVLFNRTNSQAHVGKTSIFDGKMPAIFAGYLIRVTPKKEKLTNEFLNHYLNSDVAREYGRSVMGKSVNQANISGSKLKTYPINLPKLERQHEITLELDTLKVKVQEMQALYRSKLQDISDLRQSLLQKAFAGELT